MIKPLALGAFALLLSACATDRECTQDASYRKASSVTPIRGTGELQLPESPSALRIPPISEAAKAAAAEPVSYGKGRRAGCLDIPPTLPPVEPEPAAPVK